MIVNADADQLEQLLINVTRNAVDAAIETGGAVSAGWTLQEDWVEIRVDDEGPGLSSTGNRSCRSSRRSPEARASASR